MQKTITFAASLCYVWIAVQALVNKDYSHVLGMLGGAVAWFMLAMEVSHA